MHIAIDLRFATNTPRGIGIYCINLILGLLETNPNWRYSVFLKDKSPLIQELASFDNVQLIILPNLGYFIEENILIPLHLISLKPDIFHATGNTGPLFRVSKSLRYIVTIHDVAYMKSTAVVPAPKSLYQKAGRVYRRLLVPRIAALADEIVTVSSFAKHDILGSIHSISPTKVQVNGLGFRFPAPTPSLRCQERYVIAVSGTDPQKNLRWLIDSYVLYRTQGGKLELKIVGVTREEHINLTETLHGSITFLGRLSHQETLNNIQCAQALIFPSLYESFGIPIVEALHYGIPVLAANTGAAPEICGEACLMFEGGDKAAFVNSLSRLEHDSQLREALIDKGKQRASSFTPVAMAANTAVIYAASNNRDGISSF